ncbi:MAG: DUF5686 family protein, partial [Bacteroidota bacterium]
MYLPQLVRGQTARAGQVLDARTEEPLPFATVLLHQQSGQGLTADLNGKFNLPSSFAGDSVWVRYIGYTPQGIAIPDSWPASRLTIRLQPQALDLETVEIAAVRNPALRIMRLAIARRKDHDPARLSAYQCEIYNKTVFDWLLGDTDGTPADSQIQRMQSMANYMALVVMEAVSERKHRRPQGASETVLSTRISGFKNPTFASLASDFQPFSFYANQIEMLDERFLNPLATGSLLRYHFRLEDQLITDTDTVFIIRFRPKAAFLTKGLSGQLHIHSKGYALQSVIAEPAQRGLIYQRIEQRYQLWQDSIWFPAQLHVALEMPDYPQKGMGMRMAGRSYISKVDLLPVLKARDIPIERVRMAPDASLFRDSAYWESQRTEDLSLREQRTYQLFDSLGEEKNFDQYLRLMENLLQNRWPVGPVDIDLDKLLIFNEYEGFRIGLGLHTRMDRWPRFRVGGYAAYGWRDRQFKWGGDLRWKIYPARDLELLAGIQQDVNEPGQSSLQAMSNLRRLVGARMDAIDYQYADIRFRLGRYWHWRTGLHRMERDPRYPYRWSGRGEEPFGPFRSLEWRTTLRFAYQEDFVESLGQRLSQGSRYPILTLGYQKGLNVWDGELTFDRVEAQFDWKFRLGILGQSRLRLKGGHVFGE